MEHFCPCAVHLRLFVGKILIVFASALGLCGVIAGLVVATSGTEKGTGLARTVRALPN